MDPDVIGKLSEMQLACLRLVAELKKTEQIAGDLGISPSTVNTHIERAMARLQVTTRREAARIVVAYDARQRVDELKTAPTQATVSAASHAAEESALSASSVDPLEASAFRPDLLPPVGTVTAESPRPEKHPTEAMPLPPTSASLPLGLSSATGTGRRRNDLTITQRLGLAVLALVLLCIGIAGLGAAIEQLSNWRASLATQP